MSTQVSTELQPLAEPTAAHQARPALNLRAWRLVVAGLALAGFGLRLWGLDAQSLWRDEVDAIYFAVRNLGETLSMFVQAAQNGPLYFLSLRPWFGLMGTSEFVLRFPSALAGTLSVALAWQVARRLLPGPGDEHKPGHKPGPGGDSAFAVRHLTGQGLWVSVVAAALLTLNPYQVWYGQEGKMYATITCLALLATWLWLRGMEQGGRWVWVGYWLTVSAAMYVHLLMVLIIPLHFVWLWIAWPWGRRQWRGYALALAGLTLPYLPMAWWHWWLLTAPDKLSGFSFMPLDQIVRSLLLSHVRGFVTSIDLLWLWPVYFLGGAGLLLGATQIGRTGPHGGELSAGRRFALLLSWIGLPVLFIYALSLRQPVFTERYVIWIGPAALMLLALGLAVVRANTGRLGNWLAAGLLAYVLVLWGYLVVQQKITPIKYDLRSAVHYVQTQRDPADLLILQIPHQEWSFRYYSSRFEPDPFAGSDARLGRWVGGPYTNYGEPDDEARAAVDSQLSSATAGAHTVWVMLSEAEMWDSRRLLDAWLAQHGTLVEQRNFPGVQVQRYQLQQPGN